ncbi:MAG: 7,8-didemethyl-8-hydroxy-5-deazariboflavin synthase CofG [Candidatus Xenobium sp.]|nr:7,8-didemethyl-8-hydroxy-5-deazariboflavin synthase CofG [Burkholderiales bacterium]
MAAAETTGILERALSGEALLVEDAVRLLTGPAEELPVLLKAAGEMRDQGHGRRVSFSRNVFLPLTNLCRNRCAYCSFRREPGQPGQHTMTFEEVRRECRQAFRMGCTEALFCLGDRPEALWPSHRKTLRRLGVDSTAEQVAVACRIALEEGLLPHTNAGALTREELAGLKPGNASMGLMLESASPQVVHAGCPDKFPQVRLQVLRHAGELRIPFTSGLLVGIGETSRQRVEALEVLREVSKAFGHIQEVIVQNFRGSKESPRSPGREPSLEEVVRTVAVARLMLGPDFNLQAPPNLNQQGLNLLLRAGVNDWGGLSPLTSDHINPQAPWPRVEELAWTCEQEGFRLVERLAVYPEFLSRPGFLTPTIRRRALEISAGLEVSR